jgi:hypothetical protein
VTTNEHVAVRPAASITPPVTVVLPTWKTDPLTGCVPTLMGGVPPETVGAGKVTAIPALLGAVAARFAGQLIVGAPGGGGCRGGWLPPSGAVAPTKTQVTWASYQPYHMLSSPMAKITPLKNRMVDPHEA